MERQEYNKTTLAIGVGVAVAVVFIGIIIANWNGIVHIVLTEGLLSE